MNKFYSTKEFAGMAGVSRQTLYNWMELNLINPTLYRGRRIFTQEHFEKVPEIKQQMKILKHTRGSRNS